MLFWLYEALKLMEVEEMFTLPDMLSINVTNSHWNEVDTILEHALAAGALEKIK